MIIMDPDFFKAKNSLLFFIFFPFFLSLINCPVKKTRLPWPQKTGSGLERPRRGGGMEAAAAAAAAAAQGDNLAYGERVFRRIPFCCCAAYALSEQLGLLGRCFHTRGGGRKAIIGFTLTRARVCACTRERGSVGVNGA